MSKLKKLSHLFLFVSITSVLLIFLKSYALSQTPKVENNNFNIPQFAISDIDRSSQAATLSDHSSFPLINLKPEKGNYRPYIAITVFIMTILLAVYIMQKYFFRLKSDENKYISENKKYLTLLYSIAFLVITLIIIWTTLNQLKKRILKRTGSEIQTILASTNQSVNLWIRNKLDTITNITSCPEIIETVEALLKEPVESHDLTSCSAQTNLRKTIRSHYGKAEYFLINPEYVTIGASNGSRIGTTNVIYFQRPKLLKEIFEGKRVFIPPVFENFKQRKNPVQFYCSPIKNKKGKVIAAMAFMENQEKTFTQILQRDRLGYSGEAYLFDRNGIMLSNSRYEADLRKFKLLKKNQNSILNLKLLDPQKELTEMNSHIDISNHPFTLMVKNALHKKNGINLSGYRDYRGIPVLGAWEWNNKYNMGIAVEIDKQEALNTYYLIRNILISILVAIIVLGMFFSIANIKLTEKANRLLFKYNKELEETVKARTSELKNRENELVEQKEMLLTAINSLPHPFYVVNVNDYTIALANDAAKGFIENNEENVCYTLAHNDKTPCCSEDSPCPMDEIKKTNKPAIVEHKHFDRHNNPYYTEVHGYPIFDKAGRFVQMIEYCLDITERKNSELAVKKLSTVVEQSPVTIVITDKEGNIEYVNPSFSEVTGYSEAEAIGQNPRILNSGKLPKEFYKELWDTILEGKKWHGEFSNVKKNGEEFWENASIAPITDQTGKIVNFVAVKEDITEQKKLQQQLEKSKSELRVLIDNIEAIVYLKDANGKYLIVNKHFEKLTKLDHMDIVGKTNAQIFPQNLAKKLIKEDKQIFDTGEPLTVEDTIFDDEGKANLYLSVKAPLKNENGLVYGICGIATNITYQKAIEKELRLAKKKAEDAAKTKSDFLANMSHEIRTPMNAVLGLNYLLQKTDLAPKQLEYTKKIEGAAKTLLHIINDILDFSKIEAGKLDIEEIGFNLNDVLEKIFCMMNIKAHEKNLNLTVSKTKDIPVFLIGDPLRIEQILINLTTNAIKFTKEGNIELKVEKITHGKKDFIVKFSVHDTGIGLTEKQTKMLFKSFQQADTSTTRKYGGTGLGLSISKKLAEMMNGTIGVDSVYGKGSTFYFTACLGISDKNDNCTDLLPEDLRNMHVLVVDDNNILKDYCEDFTFHTTITTNEEKVIEILKNDDSIKVVFINWDISDLDGHNIFESIKNSSIIKQKPKIIAVTDSEQSVTTEKIYLDGWVLKPVSQSNILYSVLEAFGEKIFTGNINDTLSDLSPIKGSRILLVEDNIINQQVAVELLKSNGFIVNIANDGKTAVDIILNHPGIYDIVLMDLQMPVMDGYNATKLIRENKEFDTLPIIAMSADVIGKIQEKVSDAGMNGYISKPIDIEELFKSLLTWIKPKKANHKNRHIQRTSSIENDNSIILPEIPGINTEDGLKRVGGNKNFYLKILSQFAENHLDFVPELLNAIDRNDEELAIRNTHSLKSVSGNLGATKLYESIKNLEDLLKDKFEHNDTVTKQLNEVDHLLKEIVKGLEYLNIDTVKSSSPSIPFNTDEIKAVISELNNSLSQYNANSLSNFDELQNMLRGYGYDSEMDELRKTINNFDFADANQILNSLARKIFT